MTSRGSTELPPLGEVPWLPPRAFCPNGGPTHPVDACPSCVPVIGPHDYALATATLDEVRALWRAWCAEAGHPRERAGRVGCCWCRERMYLSGQIWP